MNTKKLTSAFATPKTGIEKMVVKFCSDQLAETNDIFHIHSKLIEKLADYAASHKSRYTAVLSLTVKMEYSNTVSLVVTNQRNKVGVRISYDDAIKSESVDIVKITM